MSAEEKKSRGQLAVEGEGTWGPSVQWSGRPRRGGDARAGARVGTEAGPLGEEDPGHEDCQRGGLEAREQSGDRVTGAGGTGKGGGPWGGHGFYLRAAGRL